MGATGGGQAPCVVSCLQHARVLLPEHVCKRALVPACPACAHVVFLCSLQVACAAYVPCCCPAVLHLASQPPMRPSPPARARAPRRPPPPPPRPASSSTAGRRLRRRPTCPPPLPPLQARRATAAARAPAGTWAGLGACAVGLHSCPWHAASQMHAPVASTPAPCALRFETSCVRAAALHPAPAPLLPFAAGQARCRRHLRTQPSRWRWAS